MKTALRISAIAITFTQSVLFTGCMSQEARTNRVISRQNGIDERTAARQERWKIRGEREDARAAAFVETQ
jgi:hypothetical protein